MNSHDDPINPTWNIGYRSREYARAMGDPVLAVITARTKEEAEKIATARGLGGMDGVWAYPRGNEDER